MTTRATQPRQLIARTLTPAEAIELIREVLQQIEGAPEEEQIVAALWRHLAARRPKCVMSLGAEFEANPTEAERDPRGER